MTVLRSRPDLVDLRTLTTHWRIRRDVEGLPVIPGRRGAVTAHDLETLCVYLRGRMLRGLLRELPARWRRHQVGDREANLLAPVAELDAACRAVRAYRRPRLTAEQRAALSARAKQAKLGHSGGRKATQATVAGE